MIMASETARNERSRAPLPPTPSAPAADGDDLYTAVVDPIVVSSADSKPPVPHSQRPQKKPSEASLKPEYRAISNVYGEAAFVPECPLPIPYDSISDNVNEQDRIHRRQSLSTLRLPGDLMDQAVLGARIRHVDPTLQQRPIWAIKPGVYIPLPNGWEEAREPSTGRPYFIDHNTRCTQIADPRPLPEFWECKFDSRGWAYYVDHLAKKSFWTHPCSTQLPSGWQQMYDANGLLYYVNREKMETQWEKPEMPIQVAPVPKSARQQAQTQQQTAPAPILTEAEDTDCVIIHAWKDSNGGSQSLDSRVLDINLKLKQLGIKTWCDQRSNIPELHLADIVDHTRVCVVFITSKLMNDIRSRFDNVVKGLFTFAKARKDMTILAVALDKDFLDESTWHGPMLTLPDKKPMLVDRNNTGIDALHERIVDELLPIRRQQLGFLNNTTTLPPDTSPKKKGTAPPLAVPRGEDLQPNVKPDVKVIDALKKSDVMRIPGESHQGRTGTMTSVSSYTPQDAYADLGAHGDDVNPPLLRSDGSLSYGAPNDVNVNSGSTHYGGNNTTHRTPTSLLQQPAPQVAGNTDIGDYGKVVNDRHAGAANSGYGTAVKDGNGSNLNYDQPLPHASEHAAYEQPGRHESHILDQPPIPARPSLSRKHRPQPEEDLYLQPQTAIDSMKQPVGRADSGGEGYDQPQDAYQSEQRQGLPIQRADSDDTPEGYDQPQDQYKAPQGEYIDGEELVPHRKKDQYVDVELAPRDRTTSKSVAGIAYDDVTDA